MPEAHGSTIAAVSHQPRSTADKATALKLTPVSRETGRLVFLRSDLALCLLSAPTRTLPRKREGSRKIARELQAQSFPLGSGNPGGVSAARSATEEFDGDSVKRFTRNRAARFSSIPSPPSFAGWGAFFGMRTSNLLDTLLVPAYHFRLDRLLKRMARKKVSA